MRYTGKLSKWWKTKSCKAAWNRAKAKKRERIRKLVESVRAKRERIAREAIEWKVVE